MCHGLVAYITTVTQALTNVTPARQSGNLRSNETNITESIMGDMKAVVQPVTRPLVGAAKTIFNKTIIQFIRIKIMN